MVFRAVIATLVLPLPTLFASYSSSPLRTLEVFTVILVLYLKDLESEERISFGSSL